MRRSLIPFLTLIVCALSSLHCAEEKDTPYPLGTGGFFSGSGGAGLAPGSGGIAPTNGGSGNGGTFPPGGGGRVGVSGGTATGGGGTTTGGAGPGGGGSFSPNTAPGFTSLAPELGEPLTVENETVLTPPALTGWHYYKIDGAVCRDGSPAGFFTKFAAESDKLMVYVEGGGACTNIGYCGYNPPNVNKVISGDGQQVIGSALGLADVRQFPGAFIPGNPLQGLWDESNTANPFKGWNMVYIPYCTGDVHFGTRKDVEVPGLPGVKQQFVGHLNMQKFAARIVPTFKSKLSRGVIMGVSAGSFGAALNFSMWQDAFGSVKLDAILDSGPPFKDEFMPKCMQKKWREVWGFADSLPKDCTECQNADGGGLVGLADFLVRKHPNAHLAMISSMEDEVIRLFFSGGVKECAGYDTTDPVGVTVGQVLDPTLMFSAEAYKGGLNDLRATYAPTKRFSTYYMAGANTLFHQHTWRPRFYEPAAGGKTIAAFVQGFLDGTVEQIGP